MAETTRAQDIEANGISLHSEAVRDRADPAVLLITDSDVIGGLWPEALRARSSPTRS